MFLRDNLAGTRLEIGVKASTPGSVRETASLGSSRADRRCRLPMTVQITFTPTMVGRDEDLHVGCTCCSEDLPHMLDDIVRVEGRAAEFVELATLRQEVVVGIDDQQ